MTRIVAFEAETRRVREFAGNYAAFEAERALARERQRAPTPSTSRSASASRRCSARAGAGARRTVRGYGRPVAARRALRLEGTAGEQAARAARARSRSRGGRGGCELDAGAGGRAAATSSRACRGAVVERGAFRLGPLDLDIGWGDRVAIVGRNGAGKTTLLRALTR